MYLPDDFGEFTGIVPKGIVMCLAFEFGKLLAFAGLEPSVYQFGNFQTKKIRMSKRSSRVLRYAFMNAEHNVVKNNFCV